MSKSSKGKAASPLAAKLPLIAGIVILVVLVAAGYSYLQFQQNGGQLPPSSAAAQVSIGQPANGAELTAYEPLTVNALAAGPTPFLSMELWINGELASVQAGPSQGKTPLSAAFAWLPKEVGTFSLVARAIDENSQTSTSDPVQVMVGPNEGLAEGFTSQFNDVPAVAPLLGGGGYTPPSGPSSGDSSGEGEDWSGDPGDWIESLSNNSPPAAPELAVVGDAASCTADLSIHDLSDNEEGFAVFLQFNNGNWLQIKTLAAQSQVDWIEVSDVHLVGGQNSFYVSAFNSEGEAQSNLVSLYMDPSDCLVELAPSVPEEVQFLHFQGLYLLTDSTPDRLYCYRSVNGAALTKWPAFDYFYPEQDGSFMLDEVLQVVKSQTEVEAFSLYLECWGWYGDNLDYLGSIQVGDQDLSLGEALSNDVFQIVYEQLDGDGDIFQYGNSDDFQANLQIGINDLVFKYIYPPDMVTPAAIVTYDPEECTSHLMPDAQNLLGTILFCFPYPGFHGGFAEGDNPQPYLVWNFFKTCNLGYGTEQDGGPCHSYDYWRQMAADNNGKVGFYVYDYSSAGQHTWQIDADQLRMFNIPPNGCSGDRTFYVQMWYEEDNFKQYSQWSNPYTIACPKPVGNVLQIEFSFDTLTLNNLDDGDSGAQDVEVYGYFQVIAPSSYPGNNNFIKMGTWDKQDSDCSDDTGTGSNHRPSCPRILGNGTHNLANLPLCLSTDYTGDSNWQCSYFYAPNAALVTNYQTGQNSLTVDVTDGDAITMWVILWDWDDASANDLVCWGFVDISSKTIFEWHATDGQGFGIIAFGDVNTGSNCNISGHIEVHD